MTYAIHASKNGMIVVTIRISPIAAVDKARLLERLAWQVHIAEFSRAPVRSHRLRSALAD